MTPEQLHQTDQARRYAEQDEYVVTRTHIRNLLAIIGPAGKNRTAKQRFDEAAAIDECDPIERLRFFCSLSMNAQDWIDVEPLFDEVKTMLAAAPAEPQL